MAGIELGENAQPGAVWTPEPLGPVLFSCSVPPGCLQEPNSAAESISAAATGPPGGEDSNADLREACNARQAAEVPRQSTEKADSLSGVRCRKPRPGAGSSGSWRGTPHPGPMTSPPSRSHPWRGRREGTRGRARVGQLTHHGPGFLMLASSHPATYTCRRQNSRGQSWVGRHSTPLSGLSRVQAAASHAHFHGPGRQGFLGVLPLGTHSASSRHQRPHSTLTCCVDTSKTPNLSAPSFSPALDEHYHKAHRNVMKGGGKEVTGS